MTTRDRFALEALRWILTQDAWDDYDDMANSAYLLADAMMKRRKPAPRKKGRTK